MKPIKIPFRKYNLVNVKKPVLYREFFPYFKVPRTALDYQSVPMNLPDDIWITSTTFRDGQQARPPYTVKQIKDIYDILHRMGGKRGIIRQCEFFLYSKKDKDAVTKCLDLGYKYPQVTGWIRAVSEDFKLVKQMGLKETGILTSASDYHIFLKLKKNRARAMDDYLGIVKEALSQKIRVRCHLEDITRADFYGFVVPFAQELMELSNQSSLKDAVKIRLCDTMGYGLPMPEAMLPRSVPKLVYGLLHEAGVPSRCLEWHGHNDFHKVLINAVSAWLYGCSAANGTLFGFGERTGNPPIEALIIEYMGIKGAANGINTKVITEAADYFRKEIDAHIPSNYPFIGSEFNTTRAGIHADGVIKNEEIYNIFDTKKILNRSLGVTITDKSGAAGVAYWVNCHAGLKGKQKIDKKHRGIINIYKWVVKQYEQGRTTGISPEEMAATARYFLPELFVSEFDRLKKRAFEMAKDILKKTAEDSKMVSLSEKRLKFLLKKTLKDNPFIQRLYVTDARGIQITDNIVAPDIISTYKPNNINKNKLGYLWVSEPIKKQRIYVSDFYKSVYTDLLCISVSAPIMKKGKLKGILVADIKFEDIAKAETEAL